MKANNTHEILESAEFKAMVKKKWSFSLVMAGIMLFLYFGFILAIAFKKELLATKLGPGLTLGIPVGLGLIVFAWVLTGIYVRWANTNYDQTIEEIKKKIN